MPAAEVGIGELLVVGGAIAASTALIGNGQSLIHGASQLLKNPYGVKGGPEHEEEVIAAGREINEADDGLVAKPEGEHIRTPNGEKGYRVPDQTVRNESTREVDHYINVGVQNKNGTPVAREVRAARDITAATGKEVRFRPYKTRSSGSKPKSDLLR